MVCYYTTMILWGFLCQSLDHMRLSHVALGVRQKGALSGSVLVRLQIVMCPWARHICVWTSFSSSLKWLDSVCKTSSCLRFKDSIILCSSTLTRMQSTIRSPLSMGSPTHSASVDHLEKVDSGKSSPCLPSQCPLPLHVSHPHLSPASASWSQWETPTYQLGWLYF